MKLLHLHARAAGVLVAALSACTLPTETGLVTAEDQPVHVHGYTVEPGRLIALECAAVPQRLSEPEFEQYAVVQSTSESVSQAGQTVFAFSDEVVVPQHCWWGYHSHPRTLLRARDVETGVLHQHFWSLGYECLVFELFGGAGPITAYETCKAEPGIAPWMEVDGDFAPLTD
ncbi:MAG: hypothetical protein AAF721_16570 [Myxococcota bacterium]